MNQTIAVEIVSALPEGLDGTYLVPYLAGFRSAREWVSPEKSHAAPSRISAVEPPLTTKSAVERAGCFQVH